MLIHPYLSWDRAVNTKVMKVAIILHNMIVEHSQNGYDSDMFLEADNAFPRGSFIDEHGEDKPFMWNSRAKFNETLQVQFSEI